MIPFVKAADIGTGGARTLAGEFYTSPEIYTREMERIFSQRWLCAGREEQIREPGQYVVRNLGAESILIVRDREGEIRAFYNVCRHRGTRICEETNGRFGGAI